MSTVDLDRLEGLGKSRAEASSLLWTDTAKTPPDNFVDELSGVAVWDPWLDTSGRFAVCPYKAYGRKFVEWLLSAEHLVE